MKPVQNLVNAVHLGPVGKGRAINHQDGQSKGAGGAQLGIGTTASRILRHDQIDAMGAHQRVIARHRKRPAINDHMVVGQRGRDLGRIDETQQIAVLRLRGERVQMHSADCQHHAARRPIQRGDGGRNVRHTLPVVARLRPPCQPGQGDKRDICYGAGGNRVGAHLHGERMSCVHYMRDSFARQMFGQTFHPAKAAYMHRYRLRLWPRHPACIAERRGKSRGGQALCQLTGLGRATKDKDFWHG